MMLRRVALLVLAAIVLMQGGATHAAPAQPPQPLERGTITKRPYVVMVDNHPDAYPQSGMDNAAMVYEALAEFGITRFMVVYVPGSSPEAKAIGPVRSARLYFVQWAMGLKGVYAHAGGSPNGLALAQTTKEILNLDALRRDGTAYFTRSTKRFAPHNLYTSTASLAAATLKNKAVDLDNKDIGYLYKDELAAEKRPTSQAFSYYFLYKEELAGWTYDATSNSYLRTRRTKPAVEATTGKRLNAKNVVVIEVKERKIVGDPKGRIEQDVVGSGVGMLFQDGSATAITWKKETASAPLHFYLKDGSEVQFNRGQIWVAAIPNAANLTIK